MRKTLLATGLLLATSSVATLAHAQTAMSNFSYDYMEARIGISPVTYGAAISKSIHPNAHFIANIDSEFDRDLDLGVGVGFHAPVNNWADVHGELKARMHKDRSTSSSGDWGMEINLGVRQWLGPQLEVGGQIGHATIGGEDDTFGMVHSRFHATELFSLGVEGRFNYAYGDQILITTRFLF
ncbi:hypothetical protein [Thaumasiovibrio sp. DFM-14]|uniref:hypothetical protein n=1 Tax=Thaumasiovibrio sp. DFM-14 TaxID=3384792 RepID=UPI00399F9E40